MAIRNIRVMGDRVLTKVCRPVEQMTDKISTLIGDMFDTMYDACGVGLRSLLQVGKDEVVGLLQGGSRHVLLITGGLLPGKSQP